MPRTCFPRAIRPGPSLETRATWEAWKQTKYNKIHFKFIFQTGNNLIIYLQLGGYSGSCKRTAMQKLVYSNHSFPHNSHIWEMTLMSISPLINVVDRWPCTTTTWTSIPVYQDEALATVPNIVRIMHRGGTWASLNVRWQILNLTKHPPVVMIVPRTCGEFVTLHMKYHGWYGWYVCKSWISKEGSRRKHQQFLCAVTLALNTVQHDVTPSSWTPTPRTK